MITVHKFFQFVKLNPRFYGKHIILYKISKKVNLKNYISFLICFIKLMICSLEIVRIIAILN